MTSPSSYKTKRSSEEALAQIREGRGTQFDPRIADRFLELAAEGVIEVPREG